MKSAASHTGLRFLFRLDVLLEALEERGGLELGTATVVLYGGRQWKPGSGRGFQSQARKALESAVRHGYAEKTGEVWKITPAGLRRRQELHLALVEGSLDGRRKRT